MGSVVKINGNNSDSLHTGGAHAIAIGRIGNVPSLDRFQVIPNGKSRFKCSASSMLRSFPLTDFLDLNVTALPTIRESMGIKRLESFRVGLDLLGLMLPTVVGCGGASSPKVPSGKPADNLRQLTLAYVQYASSHRGQGPADKNALTKFLIDRNGMSEEEAASYFDSERDGKPYVIRWGAKIGGYIPPSPSGVSGSVILFEREGEGGTITPRYQVQSD